MNRNLRLRSLFIMGASFAALTAAAAPAAAQDDTAFTIEELVVTAEKREQSLQDVPVAVSAFTDEVKKPSLYMATPPSEERLFVNRPMPRMLMRSVLVA